MRKLHEENEGLMEIYELLRQMGGSANYRGFYFAAYGVWLGMREPERLLMVTKRLYPEIAEKYGTSWNAVERNIRTVIGVMWETSREGMSRIAGYELKEKPYPARFLASLVIYCARNRVGG